MSVERLSDVTHHLHHLRIVEVVDDVLEDVSVGHEAQRPEHDHDGDLLLDVRQDRDDALTDRRLLHVLKYGHGSSIRYTPKQITGYFKHIQITVDT